jgi:hypothetical protein
MRTLHVIAPLRMPSCSRFVNVSGR